MGKNLTGNLSKNEIDNGIHPDVMAHEVSWRAFQIWQERGCTHSFDMQDWLQTEQEIALRYS